MSDHDPEPSSATTPTEVKSPARFLDAVSGALLIAASIFALSAAVPSLLHAVGAPMRSTAEGGVGKGIELPKVPPEILRDPEKIVDLDHDTDDDAPFAMPETHGQMGLARGATLLRDRPSDAGKALGEIKAGELVMIVQTSGDWLQVWASGAQGGIAMGWVKKSGIAVR